MKKQIINEKKCQKIKGIDANGVYIRDKIWYNNNETFDKNRVNGPTFCYNKKEKTEEYKMQDEKMTPAKVFLAGQIFGQLALDHITGERRFYGGKVYVNIDGKECFVPIMATEEVFKNVTFHQACWVINGSKSKDFLNSFKPQNGQTKIFVYVSRISIARSEEERFYQNAVYLSGKVKSNQFLGRINPRIGRKLNFGWRFSVTIQWWTRYRCIVRGKTAKKQLTFS